MFLSLQPSPSTSRNLEGQPSTFHCFMQRLKAEGSGVPSTNMALVPSFIQSRSQNKKKGLGPSPPSPGGPGGRAELKNLAHSCSGHLGLSYQVPATPFHPFFLTTYRKRASALLHPPSSSARPPVLLDSGGSAPSLFFCFGGLTE